MTDSVTTGYGASFFTEENFRTITESMQDAIIIVNEKEQISLVNSAACMMFGYTNDEMLAGKLHDLIVPERYLNSFIKGYQAFVTTGKGLVVGRTIEIEAVRKNGRLFPVEVSISATELDGRWHAIGIIRDISERRDAERKIIEASEAAQNASRTKSEFLANMSHEIRTPLNSILGTTDLMAETDMNAEQKKHIELMRSSGRSLLTLVNNILDISRIEAGRVVLESIPFNIRDTFSKVIDTFVLRAEKKNLKLSCEIADDVPVYLRGDPNRLMQIIINLLGNSIKFTESGTIRVLVGNSDISKDKVVIKFDVVDSGIGIPPAKLESIFNSFTQADTSITRKFGGTGLGLTISKELVHLMNGEISVASQPGRGSTFSFTAVFDILHDNENESPAEKENLPVELRKNLKILLVDDSPDNRFLIKAFLKKESCIIHEATNGTEAVENFNREKWDVILMDMQMPVMDGYAATRKIREIESEKQLEPTPVVALTAHSINTEIKKCLDAGCDVHLAKPVSKNALISLIGEITPGVDSTAAEKPPEDDTAIRVTIDPDLSDLIPGYIDHRKEDVVKLHEFLKTREYREIERCGHSMKGSGGGYGFDEITRIGAFIEKAGKARNAGRIEEGIEKLEHYLEHLVIVEEDG